MLSFGSSGQLLRCAQQCNAEGKLFPHTHPPSPPHPLPSSSSFFMPSSTPCQSSPTMGPSTSYLLSLSLSLQLELFPLVDGMVDMVELYYNPPSLETSRDRVAEQSRWVGSGERGISAALSFPFLLFFLSTFPVPRALGRLESRES